MTASLFGVYNLQVLTDTGAPAASYRLYTFVQGTTTQKTAYTDAAGSVAHTYTSDGAGGQYIALNARGELLAPLFGTTGAYDLVLKTSSGAAVWTRYARPIDDASGALFGSGGAALVGFLAAGTGAVPRDMQSKARDFVNLVDYGAVAGNSSAGVKAANTTSLVSEIAAFVEQSTGTLDGSAYSNAGATQTGRGQFYFNTTLSLIRNVALTGNTAPAGNSFGSSRLVFPDASHGVIVHNYQSSNSTGADGAVIERVSIVPAAYASSGTTPAAGTSSGILMHARGRVYDSQISGWSDSGVSVIASAATGWSGGYAYGNDDTVTYSGSLYRSIQAGNINHLPTDAAWWAPGPGSAVGNANSWMVSGLRLQQNGKHGLYVSGADANAGLAIAVDASSNLRSGIYDASFLGNTYLACHVASNGSAGLVSYGGNNYYCRDDTLTSTTTPGTNAAVWGLMGAGSSYANWVNGTAYFNSFCYRSEGANQRNVFIGCYSESGSVPAKIMAPSWVIGGLHAAGFDPASTCGAVNDQGFIAPITSGAGPALPQFAFRDALNKGFYSVNSGPEVSFASQGLQKVQFGPGGIKTTTSGVFFSQATDAAEFVQISSTLYSSIDYVTSAAYTGLGKRVKVATAAGTGFNLFTGENSSAVCFQVLGNGNVQNTNNSYGAISDAKLKDNIETAASAWDKVISYRWVNYTLKAEPEAGRMLGLVAQEAEKVSPGVVYETDDYEEVVSEIDGQRHVERNAIGTTTKAVKYSIVQMLGMVALQEAMRRVEELEAKVVALESRA